MKKTYLSISLIVLCSNFCPAQAQNIHVAKFEDDKTCVVSHTFDDGLKEQYTLALPRLTQLGIKATFFINAGKINADPANIKDTTRMTCDGNIFFI